MGESVPPEPYGRKPKSPEEVREVLRDKYDSTRTGQAWMAWINRFLLFHGKRHPKEMGGGSLVFLLSAWAVTGQESRSTQRHRKELARLT